MQWDDFWDRMLCDVERLLVHVVGRGYRLQDEQGAALLQAREARRDGVLSSEAATGLVNLFGALSLQAKPVTAASLSNSAGASFEGAIQRYRNYVIVLTALIVPISLATFVSFGLTTLMKKDLDAANSLALSLQGELPQQAAPATGSPAAVLPPGVTQGEINEQLQQLSTTLRVVYNRAVIVRGLTLFSVRDPFADDAASRKGKFQSVTAPTDESAGAASTKIKLRDEMAPFTEELIDTVAVMYGAINACVLPILYAWLGACAFLLRRYCTATGEAIAIGRYSATGRLVMAGIGGMVIGFFNNLVVDSGVSVSPFALAFLVGYAIDIFYGVLENAIASLAGTFGHALGAKPGT
jgi:hypothetical protein